MALIVESSAEPIPGYRLLERLGSGGFGEVWKAEAPGGLFKAIKIVHGDVGHLDADGSHRAEQELKALRRVQTIRHPYLLSIERYDIIDGRLMIVTELADGDLYDKFEKHVAVGQPGIPRHTLLRYMREAAEVLDLMNGQHNLQHLDIKPQNLFLIHDHIKVADFGLVKDLSGVRSESNGAVTPLYAAPETFESNITPFCDQYSLAIVYQELLTGHRPFGGTTMQQLAMQHLQAPPNLSPLPHADRPAIAKALSKKPENRHATCMAFVDALAAGIVEPPQAKTGARVSDPVRGPEALNINASMKRLERKDAKPFRPETPPTQVRVRKEELIPVVIDEPARRVAPPEFNGNGVLFPALVIGLGHTGLTALKQLRQSLCERVGGMTALPHIRLLYIDTDPAAADEARHGAGGSALEADEILLIKLNRASHYLKPRRNGRSLMEGWFDSQWLYRIPRNPEVHGQRALGRLAFGDWYQSITDRMVDLLELATDPDGLSRSVKNTSLNVRTNRPRAYVIANLGGGTGSGAFIDVAYALRDRMKTLGYETPHTVGLLTLPAVDRRSPGQLSATANTFAALTELTHYCHLDSSYLCTFDDRNSAWTDTEAPFTRSAVLPYDATAPPGTVHDGPGQAAQFLVRELMQPFGLTVDTERTNKLKSARPTMEACASTFGIASMAWPRQALVRCASRRVCEAIIERWARGNFTTIRPRVATWVTEQWQAANMGSGVVVERLERVAHEVIHEAPQSMFTRLAQRLTPKGWFGGSLDTDAAHEVIARYVELLGRPESGAQTKLGLIGDAMVGSAISLGKEWGAKLAQLAVTLIEQPEFRLAGAEEAICQFQQSLEEAQNVHAMQSEKLARQSGELFLKAHQILAEPSARKSAIEFFEAIQAYPLIRLNAIVQLQVAHVCSTLSNDLGEQLSEIRFCRQRLDDLLEDFRADPERPMESVHNLLPLGCNTLEAAVAKLLQDMTENDICDLDRNMQKMMQSQYTALVHICLSASNIMANLEPAMMKIATQFVAGRVGDANAADLFLQRFTDASAATSALERAFDDAAPALGDNIGVMVGEIVALSVPTCDAGNRVAELAKEAVHQDDLTPISGHDDITFYRELPRVPLAKLPQLGPQAKECYDYISDRDPYVAHTRNDVEEWLASR